MLLLTTALAVDDTGYTPSDGLPGGGTTESARAQTSVRFLVFGDWGNGSSTQTLVAGAMSEVCEIHGCDFVVGVGDNFYPSGVGSTSDAYWTDRFEAMYDLDMPFYMVLGNHDWGGAAAYNSVYAQAQVDYTLLSDRWVMPDSTWTEVLGNITFIGLDTNTIYFNYGAAQAAWLPGELAAVTTEWTMVVGHHPYQSNGMHGNAGEYEGVAGRGQNVKDFFDAYVCGQADVYFAGHDHSLQWPVTSCAGTELLISGGGGGHSTIVGTGATNFEVASAGFLWVEVVGPVMTATFYDYTATELYSQTVLK